MTNIMTKMIDIIDELEDTINVEIKNRDELISLLKVMLDEKNKNLIDIDKVLFDNLKTLNKTRIEIDECKKKLDIEKEKNAMFKIDINNIYFKVNMAILFGYITVCISLFILF